MKQTPEKQGNEQPKVSIVIPFYNDRFVVEAIESALSQTYDELEIIVVDDGSTSHGELLSQYEGRIYYIGKSNGGTASALNVGFGLASGKYVAWLSSDDCFYPYKILRQVSAMERTGAQISHSGFDAIGEDGLVTEKGIMPPQDTGEFYRTFLGSNPVNGCTVVMTKALYKAIGPFDEERRYTHDLDYWFRVLLSGTPFHLLPDALIAYRRHEGMGTRQHSEAIARETRDTFAKYEARWAANLRLLGFLPQAGKPLAVGTAVTPGGRATAAQTAPVAWPAERLAESPAMPSQAARTVPQSTRAAAPQAKPKRASTSQSATPSAKRSLRGRAR